MKNIVSAFMLSLASVCVFGQMDSIHVTVHKGELALSTVDSTSILSELKLDAYIDDFEFLGQIYIEVVDVQFKQAVFKVKYKIEQILEEGFIVDGIFKTTLLPIFNNREYKIITEIKDYQGIIVKQIINHI